MVAVDKSMPQAATFLKRQCLTDKAWCRYCNLWISPHPTLIIQLRSPTRTAFVSRFYRAENFCLFLHKISVFFKQQIVPGLPVHCSLLRDFLQPQRNVWLTAILWWLPLTFGPKVKDEGMDLHPHNDLGGSKYAGTSWWSEYPVIFSPMTVFRISSRICVKLPNGQIWMVFVTVLSC